MILASAYLRMFSSSQGTKSKLESSNDYINALTNALTKSTAEHLNGSKVSHLVEALRITLTNNPVSWVQDFGAKGLQLVLNLLNECYVSHRG